MKLPFRRRLFKAATLLGVAQRGFFIPYAHAASVSPLRYDRSGLMLERAHSRQLSFLDKAATHIDALAAMNGPPPLPRWDQDWFPRLDGALFYTIIREFMPRRIVEIGSGHSTRFAARARADASLSCEHIAIDPKPRADIALLDVRHEARLADSMTIELASALTCNDILFIDSSHIAMPGTDVDLLFAEVLPTLAEGVLVHLHDIFLPDPYPQSWQWRGYNEQGLLAALLGSGRYEILVSSHYIRTCARAEFERSPISRLPMPAHAMETSFWMRVASPQHGPRSCGPGCCPA